MIEQFTDKELKTIINELRVAGYDVRFSSKQLVMKEEAKKVFGGDPFVCHDIGGSIFKIADFVTENFDRKDRGKYARKYVPSEVEDTYREIVGKILTVIKPYYGVTGFKDQNDPVKPVNPPTGGSSMQDD